MIKRIYLDVDGVLADFVGGTAKLLGFDVNLVKSWDYYESVGTTERDFWYAINQCGSKFWSELTPYPWCQTLYEECRRFAPTILLTSPSHHPSSLAGKLTWMHVRFGARFRDYLMGSVKDCCAQAGSLLVDDSDDNCDKFCAAGGQAVLFPRPWNKNREYSDDALAYTLAALHRAMKAETAPPVAVREFSTGAVRSNDADGVRYDLISPIGLRRLAETYAEGAKKYSPHNWLKGFPMSECLNHAQRHVELWRSGDASEDHLAHAAWNIFALMHFEESRPDLMDIPARTSK